MRRVLLACILLAACSGGSTTPTDPIITLGGTWTLVSVNGKPLPFRDPTYPPNVDAEVVSGNLEFPSASGLGRYHSLVRETAPANTCCTGDYGDDMDMQWIVNGNAVTIGLIFPLFVNTQSGTVSGNRITMTYNKTFRLPDGVYVYQKQ